VVNKVAQTPGAIGYLAASVLNAQVKAITINGAQASLANIEAGRYTFWSYEHMYTLNTLNQKNGILIDDFLSFMLSSQVQPQIASLHYLSISELHFPLLNLSATTGQLSSFMGGEERKKA
jgi:phosphate transport system substrate-binding protein